MKSMEYICLLCTALLLWGTWGGIAAAAAPEADGRPHRRASWPRRSFPRWEESSGVHRARVVRAHDMHDMIQTAGRSGTLTESPDTLARVHAASVFRGCDAALFTALAERLGLIEAISGLTAGHHMVDREAMLAATVIHRARALTREAPRLTAYFRRYSVEPDERSEGGRVSTGDGVSIEYIGEGAFAGVRIRLPYSMLKNILSAFDGLTGQRAYTDTISNPNNPEPSGIDVLVGNGPGEMATTIGFVHDSVAPNPQARPTPALPAMLAAFMAAVNTPTYPMFGPDIDVDIDPAGPSPHPDLN